MRRLARVFLLASLVLTLGVGMAWAADVQGVTDTEIRIGQWGPQTGPAAPWGAVARGSDVYFKWINEQGGVNGRMIKHLMFDDQYNPAKTKAGVKELVEGEGIFAFVSGVGTAPGLAVMDYLIEHNIPWVSPSTGATDWAFPPKRIVFAVYPNYRDEASILCKYAVETLGKKKIALIYQNDDYGKGGLKGAVATLKAKYGLELVAEVPVEAAERDLKSHIATLKNAEPEVVIQFVGPTHGVIGRKTAAAMKFEPVWMSTSTLSDVAFMNQITGGLWEGTIFTSFGALPTDDTPLMNSYREAYKKYAAKDERLGTFFLAGFGYAEPLVEGLRRCGRDVNVDKFVEAMESIKDFQGILGKITFGPGIRQGQRSMFLAKAGAGDKIEKLSDWIEPENF